MLLDTRLEITCYRYSYIHLHYTNITIALPFSNVAVILSLENFRARKHGKREPGWYSTGSVDLGV